MPDSRCPLEVLYEDNHLLIVSKPPLLPTMGVAAGRPTLLELAREYVRTKYHKPGNVFLGIVSRLDAPVTGAVLLARTSKAAARLSRQFRERRVEKVYWALVEGPTRQHDVRLVDWLIKDERHRKMRIASPETPGAQEASLCYSVRRRFGTVAHLEIQLETGRKHQIRLQLAHHGLSVLGDRKYGSRVPFPLGIALHCRGLTFEHPVRHHLIRVVAAVPPTWRDWPT
jgi:23S rRNA pseudouridine1911/1915/1917 synthase